MEISIIVAKSSNNVIGYENKLPWRIPEDLKLFKRLTMGKAIVMGRKTFESIGRPLPGRHNIILTRNTSFQAEGCVVVYSLDEALSAAAAYSNENQQQEVMIIGGAEIFEESLPLATCIYLTNIPRDFEGDAFFPMELLRDWLPSRTESIPSSAHGINAIEFTVFSRGERAMPLPELQLA